MFDAEGEVGLCGVPGNELNGGQYAVGCSPFQFSPVQSENEEMGMRNKVAEARKIEQEGRGDGEKSRHLR